MKPRAARAAAEAKSYARFQQIGLSDEEDDLMTDAPGNGAEPSFAAEDEDAIGSDDDVEPWTANPESEDDEDDLMDEDDLGTLADRRPTAATSPEFVDYHEAPRYPQDPRLFNRTWKGQLHRYAKYRPLRNALYGPELSRIKIIWDLDQRWSANPLLPPAYPPHHPRGIVLSPWLPPQHEIEQERKAVLWYRENVRTLDGLQRSHSLDRNGPSFVPHTEGKLTTLLGPWFKQEEYMLSQGAAAVLDPSGLPRADDSDQTDPPSGYQIDVGGLVLAMRWQPKSVGDSQVLAIATIPHADQDYLDLNDPRKDEPKDAGAVQFWEVWGTKTQDRLHSLSSRKPRLLGAMCFDWGRPKRLEWCPVPLNLAGILGRVAVLCGDGKVRVLDVHTYPEDAIPRYEWIDSPITTLTFESEEQVQATCLTWVHANCLALGHNDGSISVWSIQPARILQRIFAQGTEIIDICSGFPSHPTLICSVPVGGVHTLTDIEMATSEMTFFPTPTVTLQPNLISWNDTMQGFLVQYGANHGSNSLAFLHVRFFCQARSMLFASNALMSVASGSTHPYVLVGCADGALWAFNALTKLFSQKYEQTYKLKVLEHEYVPPTGEEGQVGCRGAARILHGFTPEESVIPQVEARKEKAKLKRGARGRPRKVIPGQIEEENPAQIDPLTSRHIIHDPLTRVTVVVWNPNVDFSCWAACAFASGLVRVMDLGVEQEEEEQE